MNTSFNAQLESSLLDLPDVFFKDNLDGISNNVNTIGDMVELKLPEKGMDFEERAGLILGKASMYIEAMHNSPEYYGYFKSLDTIAHRLGQSVLATFNVLKNEITPEVDKLKAEVEKLVATRLQQDGKNIVLENTGKISTNYNILEWENLISRVGGAQMIVDKFKTLSDGYSINFNMSDLNNVVRKLELDEEIVLDPEAEKDTEERIEEVSNVVPDEEIKELFKLVRDKYAYAKAAHNLISATLNTNVSSKALELITPILDHQYDVVRRMKNVALNLPEEYINKIHANIDKVLAMFDTAAYAYLVLRKHYGASLVIDTNTINGDQMDEFKSKGGKLEDVTKYLMVYYPTGNIPDTGIDISTMMKAKQDTDNKYGAMMSSMISNRNAILRQYNNAALRDTLNKYLMEMPVNKLPDNTNNEQFMQMKKGLVLKACNSLDASEDENMDNVLYAFVINTHYEGTAVMEAHNLFGAEMVKQIEANKDINNDTYSMIDAKVAASMCANFIANELLEV